MALADILPGARARRARAAFEAAVASATVIPLPPRPATTAAVLTSWTPSAMSRDVALAVPSVRRARAIIAGTIGTMQLVLKGADGVPTKPGSHDVVPGFLNRPDPAHTLTHILTWTVDDLMFHSRAYWEITGTPRDTTDAGIIIPKAVQRLDPPTVRPDPQAGVYWVGGRAVPAARMIPFEHSAPPITDPAAAGTIINALELEAAALRYARAPLPQAVIKNLGAILDDDEADALVTSYETARRTSSTAFLNAAVELETQGWDPSQLQLVEARQHVSAEVARLCNIDARWINAPSETALTYINIQDLRRDLVDITLRPYMATIDQTLSVSTAAADARDQDVGTVGYQLCSYGKTITLDPRTFLALSDKDRADLWRALIDAGVLTVAEARALEPLAPRGLTDATP